MSFLQIATLLKSAGEDDPKQIVSVFKVLFDWHSVGNELVVGSEVR